MQAEIGIIGGTGLYDPKLLKNIQEVEVNTPYGGPSAAFTLGELAGRKVAFLARHGLKHTIRPTDVNSRANIFAFKKLGVQRVLAVSTVGSLKEEYKPGDLAFLDQFIDRTTRREQSFLLVRQGVPHKRCGPHVPRNKKNTYRRIQNPKSRRPSDGNLRLHRRTEIFIQSGVKPFQAMGRRRSGHDAGS